MLFYNNDRFSYGQFLNLNTIFNAKKLVVLNVEYSFVIIIY